MKTLTVEKAFKQAREGKLEFMFDAHKGLNQVRIKKANNTIIYRIINIV